MKTYMVFDVESIGLHGEGFQVGFVVVDESGATLDSGNAGCSPDRASGTDAGRMWIERHCKCNFTKEFYSPPCVRDWFWQQWMQWHSRGATLWSDCIWPVESTFLSDCVADGRGRRDDEGPYPCYDVMTLRLAAGLDPHEKCDHLPNELPEHDALADARQSARLMMEAFAILAKSR